jgi:hypothetical protein
MSKAVVKDVLPMAKAFLGTHEVLTQMSEVLTTHGLEFAALEQVPHLFLRILREARSQASVPDGAVCPSDGRETA